MKIKKDSIIIFVIGICLAISVSVFRSFRIDYLKIIAHAIIYFSIGIWTYNKFRQNKYAGLFMVMPSLLILVFASIINFDALHKWIIEAINLSLSFCSWLLFNDSKL